MLETFDKPKADWIVAGQKTSGIAEVAAFAADAAYLSVATRIDTCRRTKSAASSFSRSFRPSEKRYSTKTFCSTTKPASANPLKNGVRIAASVAADRLLKYPITGVLVFCASAANGHAIAPPRNVMNPRLRMATPDQDWHRSNPQQHSGRPGVRSADVRFGSKADMCSAHADVR